MFGIFVVIAMWNRYVRRKEIALHEKYGIALKMRRKCNEARISCCYVCTKKFHP